MVIGTSLAVYPAASLINYTPVNCQKYLIDPNEVGVDSDVKVIKEKASKGVKILLRLLKS